MPFDPLLNVCHRCESFNCCLTLQIRSGPEFGHANQPYAPVFCIWMLAFASFRLRSKFDIPNGTRWLGYLDAILP